MYSPYGINTTAASNTNSFFTFKVAGEAKPPDDGSHDYTVRVKEVDVGVGLDRDAAVDLAKALSKKDTAHIYDGSNKRIAKYKNGTRKLV